MIAKLAEPRIISVPQTLCSHVWWVGLGTLFASIIALPSELNIIAKHLLIPPRIVRLKRDFNFNLILKCALLLQFNEHPQFGH